MKVPKIVEANPNECASCGKAFAPGEQKQVAVGFAKDPAKVDEEILVGYIHESACPVD